MANVDIFVKINEIKGESKDKAHKDEIQVESASWGVNNSGTGHSGGGSGGGKASFAEFHISKTLDKSSPLFFAFCSSGKHMPKAEITFRKAGETPQDFLVVTLEDIFISHADYSGSGGGSAPHESVSINYSKITVDYKEQNEKGQVTGSIKHGWDIKQNAKV